MNKFFQSLNAPLANWHAFSTSPSVDCGNRAISYWRALIQAGRGRAFAFAAARAAAAAAHPTLPVLGGPRSGGAINGWDSLLATVQMPKGIPVATVAVDGAMNAALLAVQMLAVGDPDLVEALEAHREEMVPR